MGTSLILATPPPLSTLSFQAYKRAIKSPHGHSTTTTTTTAAAAANNTNTSPSATDEAVNDTGGPNR